MRRENGRAAERQSGSARYFAAALPFCGSAALASTTAQILEEPGPPPGTGLNPAYLLAVGLALLLIACVALLVRVRQSMARASSQQDALMRALVARSNKLEATLSSMVEGVLAVDMEQRLISLNEAAGKLLNIRPERAAGRHIDEVIASPPLRDLVCRTLESEQPIQADIELSAARGQGEGAEPSPRMFQAQGAVLHDTDGRRVGTLVVLHDVTRLRRLEVVRRDFVSNASHEIKTPVAAIKAAAETLLDTGGDPEAVQQFLPVIARQADRLQNIVEDLLALARIEQDTEHSRIRREVRSITKLLASAAENCATRATHRGSRIVIDCADDLEAAVNETLLEQAVINLLDNAIKYSPPGATVYASGSSGGAGSPGGRGEVVIAVRDEGPGIAAEHLPRVFERFYRTDKARGRDLGGTGLGLAIVKHIAIAHGGRVTVSSALGEGSTFRIHIPVQS